MGDRAHVADWTSDWDVDGRQYHEQAPELWHERRDAHPAPHTDRYGGAWALFRYEDVSAAAHDPTTFSSVHTSLTDEYERRTPIPPLDLDPPRWALR